MVKAEELHDITNEAVFYGTIVSIRGKGNNGSITLACPLITNTRRQGKLESNVRVNYPSLSFNKDTKTENIPENFKVKDHVRVTGHVQSYLQMDENTGDTREIVNVYIDEITLDSSKMMNMFCKEGRTYSEARNEVYLSGNLLGIVKRTDSILSIRLDVSGQRKNYINAIFFRAPSGLAGEFVIGERVDVLAMVQTVNTKENKKSRNYQDLVILDMSK